MNGQKLKFPDKDAKIYWILLYMQTGSAKTWRDYIIALMYKGQQLFSMSDELLKEIDRKFGDMNKRTTQSLKIRTIQQGDRLVDEHVQEFEKAALEAGYEGYLLVVEFKCSLNSGLKRRLTELWPMPVTIQQWYDEAIMMDRQWKIARTGIFLWKSKWNCEETLAAWPTRARARTRTRRIIATGISATILQEPDAATTQTASEYWTAATRPECDGC